MNGFTDFKGFSKIEASLATSERSLFSLIPLRGVVAHPFKNAIYVNFCNSI